MSVLRITHASPTMRLAALACAVFGLVALPAAKLRADDLIVKYDQASIIRLSRPAAEIIIGNPTIADVSVQSGTSLVITGKSFGVTNIIAIDAQGQIIRDQRIMVRTDDERLVSVTKAGARQSYSCTPNCQPTVTVGDDDIFFKRAMESAVAKAKASESAGGGGQSGGQ